MGCEPLKFRHHDCHQKNFHLLRLQRSPGAETIWAYDVAGEGKIENRRKFAPIGCDGMTMDTFGNVYCTWKGELWIYSKSGKELKRIAFPEGPANCTLIGGTLYVTARTGFYAVHIGNMQGVVPIANAASAE
jgi:sugar lactone lactonase YvrE